MILFYSIEFLQLFTVQDAERQCHVIKGNSQSMDALGVSEKYLNYNEKL